MSSSGSASSDQELITEVAMQAKFDIVRDLGSIPSWFSIHSLFKFVWSDGDQTDLFIILQSYHMQSCSLCMRRYQNWEWCHMQADQILCNTTIIAKTVVLLMNVHEWDIVWRTIDDVLYTICLDCATQCWHMFIIVARSISVIALMTIIIIVIVIIMLL